MDLHLSAAHHNQDLVLGEAADLIMWRAWRGTMRLAEPGAFGYALAVHWTRVGFGPDAGARGPFDDTASRLFCRLSRSHDSPSAD